MGALAIVLIILFSLIFIAVIGVIIWYIYEGSQPICKANSDCKYGFICKDGNCVKATGGCKTDRDCPVGDICSDGKCAHLPIEIPQIKITAPVIQKPVIKQEVRKPPPQIIIPKKVRKLHYSSEESMDDEINSEGSQSDPVFDIVSLSTESSESSESEENSEISISTPYVENKGNYLCKAVDDNTVLDVCSYSVYNVFLLENTDIVLQHIDTKEKNKIGNNIPLQNIVSYNGYLYGLGTDNALYMLPTSYFTTNYWIWKPVKWAPVDIIHMSTTQDFQYLWLQTNEEGYLYQNNKLVKQELAPYIRVYGSDINNYLEYDAKTSSIYIYPSRQVIQNVVGGAMDYYNSVTTLSKSQASNFRKVVIVNWQPFFIRK